jgi:hypothetical protein
VDAKARLVGFAEEKIFYLYRDSNPKRSNTREILSFVSFLMLAETEM